MDHCQTRKMCMVVFYKAAPVFESDFFLPLLYEEHCISYKIIGKREGNGVCGLGSVSFARAVAKLRAEETNIKLQELLE